MRKFFVLLFLFFCLTNYSQSLWTKRDSLPSTARIYPAIFTIGNYAYLVSGNNNLQFNNEVWRYDGINHQWKKMNPFPGTPRSGAQSFTIGGKGYVIGGFTSPYFDCNDLWEYNPAQDSWQQKATFPGWPRTQGIAFSIGNNGFYGTGVTTSGVLNDFWKYNALSNTWTQIGNFPGNPRGGAIVYNLGGKFYAGLGSAAFNTQQSDMYEYIPSNDIWLSKGPTGFLNVSLAYFSLGNKGYIGTSGVQSTPCGQGFWCYDPVTNSFDPIESFPGSPRCGSSGFSIGNKGFICFGDVNNWTLRRDIYQFSTDIVHIGTQIDKNATNQSLDIFPNPIKDKLHLTNVPEEFFLQIYDLRGRKVYSNLVRSAEIDITALDEGFYTLILDTGAGVLHKSFVKLRKD